MRLPKVRRPRERAWEFANIRQFGLKEGAQNLRTWAGSFFIVICLASVEGYRHWQRILSRGDSCPACETARENYRERQKKAQAMLDPKPDSEAEQLTEVPP